MTPLEPAELSKLVDQLAGKDVEATGLLVKQTLAQVRLQQGNHAGGLPLSEVGDNPYDNLPRYFPVEIFEALKSVTGGRRDPLLQGGGGTDFRSKRTPTMTTMTFPVVVYPEDIAKRIHAEKRMDTRHRLAGLERSRQALASEAAGDDDPVGAADDSPKNNGSAEGGKQPTAEEKRATEKAKLAAMEDRRTQEKALNDGVSKAEKELEETGKENECPLEDHRRRRRFLVTVEQEWVFLGYSLGSVVEADSMDPGTVIDERTETLETQNAESASRMAADTMEQLSQVQRQLNETDTLNMVRTVAQETASMVESSTSAGIGLKVGASSALGLAKGLVKGGLGGAIGLGGNIGSRTATSTITNTTNTVDRTASRIVNQNLESAQRRVNEHVATMTRTARTAQRRLDRLVSSVSPLMARVTNLMRWTFHENYAVLTRPVKVEQFFETSLCDLIEAEPQATRSKTAAKRIQRLQVLFKQVRQKRISKDELLKEILDLYGKDAFKELNPALVLKEISLAAGDQREEQQMKRSWCDLLASEETDFTLEDLVDMRQALEPALLEPVLADGFDRAREILQTAADPTPTVKSAWCRVEVEATGNPARSVRFGFSGVQAEAKVENRAGSVLLTIDEFPAGVSPAMLERAWVSARVWDTAGPNDGLTVTLIEVGLNLSDGAKWIATPDDVSRTWVDDDDASSRFYSIDITANLEYTEKEDPPEEPPPEPMPLLLQHINRNKEYYLGVLLEAGLIDSSFQSAIRRLRDMPGWSDIWGRRIIGFNGLKILEVANVTPAEPPGEDPGPIYDPALRMIWTDGPEGTLVQLAAPGHYSEAIEGLLSLGDALGMIHPKLSPTVPHGRLPIDVNINPA